MLTPDANLFYLLYFELMACYVYEHSELNVAGTPGFEPGKAVLETAVITVSPRPYA